MRRCGASHQWTYRSGVKEVYCAACLLTSPSLTHIARTGGYTSRDAMADRMMRAGMNKQRATSLANQVRLPL